MLEVKNVSKEFHDLRTGDVVLKNISFKLKKGELASLIGPSGCGKTVLLKIIAGLESADGEVSVRSGRPVIVWQDYRLFPWRTLYRNVAYPLEIRKMDAEEIQKRVKDILEMLHIWEFRDYYPYQLSGGQQQRAAIARALNAEAKLLLLDEPFSNIDWRRTNLFFKELTDIQKKKDLTIMLVTHDIMNAMRYSDKVIVMSQRPSRVKAVLASNHRYTIGMQKRIQNLME
jgi:NitT/TauT family transport system ATP-binding protein